MIFLYSTCFNVKQDSMKYWKLFNRAVT